MKKDYSTFGSKDAKGHWKPPYPHTYAPPFEKGTAKDIMKFIFGWGGYIYPRNVFIFCCLLGLICCFRMI